MAKVQIYFDGGCKPNPGMMELGIVILETGNSAEPMTWFEFGQGTNNLAEWSALIWAVQIAEERGYTDVEYIGDSIMVINQADNKWKIKERSFLPFKETFLKLNSKIKGTLTYIPRDKNKAGTYLEHGLV
jgi:ribonuclease HI